MWIRADGAFPGIISQPMFDAAQAIIAARSFRLSDDEMLSTLRDLFLRQGMLSGLIIDETEGLPSSSAFRSRFGSLLRAYGLVGYTPRRDFRYIAVNRELRRLHPEIEVAVMTGLAEAGAVAERAASTDLIEVNGEFSVSVVIARCRLTPTGSLRWRLRFDTSLQPDITVAVRMDASNRKPFDYYLLPRLDIARARLNLAEDNQLRIDAYRFDTLDLLFELARRTSLSEAA